MANTEKSTECLSCSTVLYIMVILGFMLNYALRVNLTIAIVAMVKPTINETAVGLLNGTADGPNATLGDSFESSSRFDWDTHQRNLLLGCFFWGYILTEVPGGRMAEVFGTKRIFGYSMLFASLVTLLSPLSSSISYTAFVVIRVLVGFFLGATWPAIHPMAAKWIPPMDRSKFMSNMMASSLGAAITMPICGFLIDTIGWESVFYFTGGIGFIWSLLWFALIYDSPAQHPRISMEERNYIEKAIGTTNKVNAHAGVPWKQILTSGPVWAIIITHAMSIFGYYTIINQLPTYMQTILKYDIKSNGLLSSLPYLGKYSFSILTSSLADGIRKTGMLTTTATRKAFTTFAVGLPSFLMIAQVYLGHDRLWSIVLFTIGLTINGGVTAGYLGNGLDIAPNFSGTIFGMANTLSAFGGYISTFMVGSLTYQNQTYGQWQIVFWILAGTYCCGTLTYLLLGSGELQPWNSGNPSSHAQNGKAIGNGTTKGEHNPDEQIPLREKIAV